MSRLIIQASFIGGAGRIQRQPGHASENLEIDPARLNLGGSVGRAMPDAVLRKMEQVFKADFSDVRIYQGPQAASIGAHAFTMGSRIYFAPGQYSPDTARGQQLLGHELAHVVQQRSGRVRTPPGSGVTIVTNYALEAEADRMGVIAASHLPSMQAKIATPLQKAADQASLLNRPRNVHPVAGVTGSAAVQMVKRLMPDSISPKNAVGALKRYELYGRSYCDDSRGHSWRWDLRGMWVSIPRKPVPLYGRIRPTVSGKGAPRANSFLSRLGSGARYGGKRAKLVRLTPVSSVGYRQRRKPSYKAAMLAATTLEGKIATDNATTYAAFFPGVPVIANGYNWCHLVGRGAGGSDDAANIVAASTHCNSEQLLIERLMYKYPEKGLAIAVSAELHGGSLYLAKKLLIEVYLNNKLFYRRFIDGFRSTAPSFIELKAVEDAFMKALGS